MDDKKLTLKRPLQAQEPASPAAQTAGVPATWEEAQRVCDLSSVDEAIRGFLEDQTGYNATCMVRTILNSAPQLRIAQNDQGLFEYNAPQAVAEQVGDPNSLAWIIMGYGETDYPEFKFASTKEEAFEAVIGMMFDPASEMPKDERESLKENFDDRDNWSLGEKRWEITFEIGGIEVTNIGAAHPQAAQAKESGNE